MKFLFPRLPLSIDFLWLSLPFSRPRRRSSVRIPMFDILFVVVGCGLFFVAVAYAYVCDRL